MKKTKLKSYNHKLHILKYFLICCLIMLLPITLIGCNSKTEPLDKIYTGRYVYIPEDSLDVGAGSQIYVREDSAHFYQVYVHDAVINGTNRNGNVVGTGYSLNNSSGSGFLSFDYSTTSFTAEPYEYTVTWSPYYESISASGDLYKQTVTVGGTKFKAVPSMRLWGTQMVRAIDIGK